MPIVDLRQKIYAIGAKRIHEWFRERRGMTNHDRYFKRGILLLRNSCSWDIHTQAHYEKVIKSFIVYKLSGIIYL